MISLLKAGLLLHLAHLVSHHCSALCFFLILTVYFSPYKPFKKCGIEILVRAAFGTLLAVFT